MNDNPNPKSSATQCRQILHHMQTIGAITQYTALVKYGCMRLASRICDLRAKGYDIIAQRVTTNNGKTICQYSLKQHQ